MTKFTEMIFEKNEKNSIKSKYIKCIITNKQLNFVVFVEIKESKLIITDYITLVEYLSVKLLLDTIKLVELKKLKNLNYIKGTQKKEKISYTTNKKF